MLPAVAGIAHLTDHADRPLSATTFCSPSCATASAAPQLQHLGLQSLDSLAALSLVRSEGAPQPRQDSRKEGADCAHHRKKERESYARCQACVNGALASKSHRSAHHTRHLRAPLISGVTAWPRVEPGTVWVNGRDVIGPVERGVGWVKGMESLQVVGAVGPVVAPVAGSPRAWPAHAPAVSVVLAGNSTLVPVWLCGVTAGLPTAAGIGAHGRPVNTP